jgi:hypothetical protein
VKKKALWAFKNMESWCIAASSRISLVKGERNVRYGETAPDDCWFWN